GQCGEARDRRRESPESQLSRAARHQTAFAALRTHAVLTHEPAGARDSRRRAVPGRRVDPDRAAEASLAEEPAPMGQQKRRNLVSRDHCWWARNGWSSAAGLGLARCPALSAAITSWADGLPQLVVVDTDVGPVQAGASKGAAIGQAKPALRQFLELDLRPGADEEVVAGILCRAPADDHVASHDRARKQRVQGLRAG